MLRKTQWYAYAVNPIDMNWEMLPRLDDMIKGLMKEMKKAIDDKRRWCVESDDPEDHYYPFHLEIIERNHEKLVELLRGFEVAKKAAKQVGWEGDGAYCASVLPLPADVSFEIGFVWKQSNNGTTYVVSPVELPYLEGMSIDYARGPLKEVEEDEEVDEDEVVEAVWKHDPKTNQMTPVEGWE